jgi:hypothetical protein
MCLSIYLGTTRPIRIPEALQRHLGVEKATWTPPPLRRRHPFVYYLGAKGAAPKLECSCLLSEHVEWTEAGAVVQSNDSYPDEGPCPFQVLRALCDEATQDGGFATIVCDDGGGAEQECSEADYDAGFVRLGSIARGQLLFADTYGGFPWRVFYVVR